MNRIYSIVWSKTKHVWVVASEIAHRYGGSGGLDQRVTDSQAEIACNLVRPIWPLRLGVLLVLLAMYPSARAADYYWDTNDATAGAGGPAPSGTWSTTDTTLSTDPNGSAAVAPHTTTIADRLFFSAGTDATGSYTVTVDGTQNIGHLTFQEGAVNLTGGTINFGAGLGLINGTATGNSISSIIAGSGTLHFNGGTIILNGSAANTYSGIMQVGGPGSIANATLILAAPGGNAVSGSELRIGHTDQVTPSGIVRLDAADQINDTATVSIRAGHYTGSSFFRMNGFNETIGGINLTRFGAGSNAIFENGAATDATVTLAGSGTYTTASGDRLFGRAIRDGGAGKLHVVVALTGTGSQTFAGADPTYTGNTTINSGTLRLWNTSGWASNVVLNGGTLQLHQTSVDTLYLAGAATRTHSQTISGTGGTLRKTGDGTIILSGANTYQGATQIDGGILRAGSATAFGNNSAVTLANTAGATMDLNNFNITVGSLAGGGTTGGNVLLGSGTLTTGGNNTSTTYGGVISGTGGLIKEGTGTFALSGANTYTGGTTISSGTLQLGAGGTTGSIVGNVVNNGVLAFNRSDQFTFSGIVSGSGAVSQVGTGTTILTSANTYTGGTSINAGTLRISSDSNLGNAAGGLSFSGGTLNTTANITSSRTVNLVTNGTILTDPSTTLTLNNVVSGAGSLTKSGTGSLVLTAANTYTGGTTVSAGTLQVGNGGTSGSITGNVVNNAALVFNRSDNLIYDGAVSGTGMLNQIGTGTTILTGASTYTGGTTISAGTLQLGNGSTSGSIVGDIINNASLVLNRSDALTLGGQISGTGAVNQIGSGTTILTGNNTYTGGTTIAAGVLQLGNGGTSGSISGNVVNNGALEFNRSNLFTFGGLISGTGAVNQIGSGTTVLTGNNTYTGPTTVAAGSLFINGNHSGATGPVSVNAGGTLGGIGTIGSDVTVANGGTLSPGGNGTAPGVLTINGDLLLNNSSGLAYDFGQANVVGGPLNDLTVVNGNLTLDGTINIANSGVGSMSPGVYRAMNYSGTLNNQTLDIGSTPGGTDFFVQTSIANQINLVNRAGLTLNFWDGNGAKNSGTIEGGNGVWQASAGNDNWTSATGVANAPYADGAFAIFMGAPGTVTVDNSQGNVTASGMQLATSGYIIQGDMLTLSGSPLSTIRVGDGTAAGAGMTATISSVLAGNTQLVKADLGTLVLMGANTYTNGTAIEGGTLQIANDSNLGNAAGAVTLNGGILRTTTDISTGRALNLASTGALETDAGTTLTLTGAISGAGSLTKTGTGSLVFSNPATHTGTTTVAAGTLRAGAANVLSAASSHSVLTGATLDLAGFDQTIAALTHGGTVSLSSGTPGTRLTVSGDYTGTGGTFLLNTTLRGDSSVTDQLIVNGNTSGAATLRVTNVGGTGAQTVEGIKIVDVGGISNANFTLQGDYSLAGTPAVIGGAYAYTLQKNGLSTPTDGDWYLRSALINTPAPAGPIYQPGAPLYEAYPQVLLSLNSLPTFQQRVGNRYWADAAAESSLNSGDAIQQQFIWGRIEGGHIRNEADSSTTRTRWDADQMKLQGGIDGLFMESQKGQLFGGVNLQYGRSSSDIRSFYGNGDIKVNGYSTGASLTWSGVNGFYIDGQGQASWYDSDLSSDELNRKVAKGNKGSGYALGVEAGQRFALDETWTLTPQVQLVHSKVDFDGFTDPYGARVSLGKGDSLVARLGVLANYRTPWRNEDGRMTQTNFYGIANLYHEFKEDVRVNVSGTRLTSSSDRTWGSVGLGGSLAFAHGKYTIYGEAMAKTSLENPADSYAFSGKVGFNVYW